MKKLNYTAANYRLPIAACSAVQRRSKTSFKACLGFGLVMGALFFTSCSDMDSAEEELILKSPENKEFMLVPAQSEPIRIKAASASEGEGLTTTKAAADNRGRFDITLKYLLEPDARQVEVFEAAAARWEQIIIKDVPSITGTVPSAFLGFPPVVENGTIDDIIIEVVIAPIDGPGNILGQAGPVYARDSDGLPLSGVMFFDVDDLELLDAFDLFEDVIVHEMGHVLGVGTLWNYGRTLREGPVDNPYFTGHMANVHWQAEGGTDALPIENLDGPGTALSHWRESVLDNELLTGFINLGENPLSRITAGSMRDLGYGTAVVGEQYALPDGNSEIEISTTQKVAREGINIAEGEIILKPIGVVVTE